MSFTSFSFPVLSRTPIVHLKSLAGTLTSGGSLARAFAPLAFAGSLNLSATLQKAPIRMISGSLSSGNLSGVLTVSKVFLIDLAGGLTSVGALIPQSGRLLAGQLTLGADLIRESIRSLAGSLSLSGIVASLRSKVFDGVITPAGALIQFVTRTLDGTIAPDGVVVKTLPRTVAGVLSFVGGLVGIKSLLTLLANDQKLRYRPRWLVDLTIGVTTKHYSSEDLDDVP